MPKVIIDTTPLESGHKYRGVGTYTRELIQALKQQTTHINFIFTSEIDTIPADLVHYPYFDLFFATLPLFRTRKTVVTIHDVIPLRYPEKFPSGLRGALSLYKQKVALSTVDAIITDSQSSSKEIQKLLGVPSHKIHPVLLAANENIKPADEAEQQRIRKKYSLPEEFLLFVGSISYNKNIPRLIRAVKELGQIKLVINTQTDIHSPVKEKQTRLVLDSVLRAMSIDPKDMVQFIKIDSATDLPGLYSSASAYIQPSLMEGFGLPVLEAMQAQTVILSSQSGSLPEVAGEAALYFDPTSVDSIKSAISRFLHLSKTERKSYIRKGKLQAQKFNWAKTARETIRVYETVLGQP